MIFEHVKLIFHSVGEKMTEKLTEVIGWSVYATMAVITGISIFEVINGVLQMIALVVTIAGGVATYIYMRKKTKNLPDDGSRRNSP